MLWNNLKAFFKGTGILVLCISVTYLLTPDLVTRYFYLTAFFFIVIIGLFFSYFRVAKKQQQRFEKKRQLLIERQTELHDKLMHTLEEIETIKKEIQNVSKNKE
ncbi:hypothetical protein NRIC_35590 [Enterococcus florum]|uniref:Uncharacterized protein n=1 Tax=Enterococcus florum TaxID=2480627 RepID=A0A4P5PH62_9ENTE|nr:hypothetical protein [Enterococcus florum]GCF95668.1 hypothetical protein NRIC_35590 [Enterococcus florum]